MPTQYHVYRNDGAGGPVDYSTSVTTASLTYSIGSLTYPGTYQFAVRAFNSTSGVEEKNVDAVVTLILDAAGNDVTARPYAPTGLLAIATASGGARVSWSYPMPTAQNRPSGFHVYRGTGSVSYTTPVGTVAYISNWAPYRFDDGGLAGGTTYLYSVRAYNATAEEANTVTASVTADDSPPADVEGLTVDPV